MRDIQTLLPQICTSLKRTGKYSSQIIANRRLVETYLFLKIILVNILTHLVHIVFGLVWLFSVQMVTFVVHSYLIRDSVSFLRSYNENLPEMHELCSAGHDPSVDKIN